LTIFTDPKAKKSENVLNNQYKGNVFNFKLIYIISVTNVKTTPVAETIVRFYEIAHF